MTNNPPRLRGAGDNIVIGGTADGSMVISVLPLAGCAFRLWQSRADRAKVRAGRVSGEVLAPSARPECGSPNTALPLPRYSGGEGGGEGRGARRDGKRLSHKSRPTSSRGSFDDRG